jgi:predicted RNA-binding protein YlxR (DUF448 family)
MKCTVCNEQIPEARFLRIGKNNLKKIWYFEKVYLSLSIIKSK